jgi:hypothetical protein
MPDKSKIHNFIAMLINRDGIFGKRSKNWLRQIKGIYSDSSPYQTTDTNLKACVGITFFKPTYKKQGVVGRLFVFLIEKAVSRINDVEVCDAYEGEYRFVDQTIKKFCRLMLDLIRRNFCIIYKTFYFTFLPSTFIEVSRVTGISLPNVSIVPSILAVREQRTSMPVFISIAYIPCCSPFKSDATS